MCYTPRTQNKLVLRTIGILIEEDSVHGYLSLPRCSQEVKRALTSGKLYCGGCIQECICISICITCICLRMSIQQLSSGPMSQLLLEFNNTYLLIQFYPLPRIFILCFHQGHCFGGSGYFGVGQPQFFFAEMTAMTLGKIIRLLGFTFELPPPIAQSGFPEGAAVRFPIFGKCRCQLLASLLPISKKYTYEEYRYSCKCDSFYGAANTL